MSARRRAAGGPAAPPGWRPPRLWRAAQVVASGLVWLLARLRVTGQLPDQLRHGRRIRGPLILAANHIGPFDPVALTAACRQRRVAPRFLAAAELFGWPLLGPLLRHCGHLPVHRRTPIAPMALPVAAAALTAGSVVLVYPEGGIGLDPDMWPQRGRTGVGRLALATGAPVVPVAQWGAHEVVPYAAPHGLLRALPAAFRRRPLVRVRFGAPVDLSDLRHGVPGQARRATDRIVAAITENLLPLRVDEPARPRHHDPSRPARPPRPRPATPAARPPRPPEPAQPVPSGPSGPDPLRQE
jgi:1-acyl-sn-glycerol-3-phosphate acyltransferase